MAPDLARGVMLAPIAMANVMIYLHARPYGLRQHIVETGTLDRAVTAGLVVLVDARSYPLFAALFGYGLISLAQRQRNRGLDEVAVRALLRRRSWWLVSFGAAHAVLAFSGDVLGWYGVLGVVLAARIGVSDRVLLYTAALWLVLAGVVQGVVYANPGVRTQRSFLWSFAIEDPIEATAWRSLEWVMTPFGLLAVLSPMLIGMWAARRNLLETPLRHRVLLGRVAVLGVGSGILSGVGMALVTVDVWNVPFPVILVLSWLHITTGVLCGLGYAALIALWAERLARRSSPPRPVALPRLVQALRAAGERSLSCYLAQTVVFATLLPAWSLGWGADLSSSGAVVLAVSTWALTVLAAAWLGHLHRQGPAEMMLRRLTYGSTSRRQHSRGGSVRASIG